jgi:pyruvate kinase
VQRRYQVTDIGNAVFDGTDCLSLSAETAKGRCAAAWCTAANGRLALQRRNATLNGATPRCRNTLRKRGTAGPAIVAAPWNATTRATLQQAVLLCNVVRSTANVLHRRACLFAATRSSRFARLRSSAQARTCALARTRTRAHRRTHACTHGFSGAEECKRRPRTAAGASAVRTISIIRMSARTGTLPPPRPPSMRRP